MLTPFIYLAAALALFGLAVRRDRTALVLLASLVMAEIMQRSGVSFHPLWWAALDAVAFILITMGKLSRRDIAVLLLFIPAWVAYLLPDDPRYLVTSLVVIAQFMLVTPWGLAWMRAKETQMPDDHPFDDFHLQVRA